MENNLPESWENSTLKELCAMVYGKGLLTKFLTENGYPVFGANGIIGKYSSFMYDIPQVIISCRGAASGVIHKTVPNSFVTSNSIVLALKSNEIDLDYFKNALSSVDKSKIVTGSAQPQITIENLNDLKIPIAPLPEQHRIVAKLDALMQKVESNKQRLDKIPKLLKRFRQSVLADAVCGKLTNKIEDDDIPANWRRLCGKDVFEFITSGSRGWAEYYAEEGKLFIRITNLSYNTIIINTLPSKNKYVNPPKNAEGIRTRVNPNDILISITGDVGMVGLVEPGFEEAFINQHVCLARPKSEFYARYIAYYIAAMNGGRKYFDEVKKGATKSGLVLGDIKELPIPIPPIEEQIQIVKRVEQLFALADKVEARYTKAKAMLDKLPQTILAKAFRGGLVPQDADDEPASVLLERIKEGKEKKPNFKKTK